MLIVKYDPKRDPAEGEYWVELTKNRDLTIVNCDRLGYWCDKRHLRSMAREILEHFRADIFDRLLGDMEEERDLNG